MSSDGSLIRPACSPGETLVALIAWQRTVRDYRILHGRCGATTQIQDALRFTELKERATEQLDTQSFLNTHHAFHVVGRQLADEAERHGIDATALYSFLDRPDPDDGARRALVVTDRLKALLLDRPKARGASPAPPAAGAAVVCEPSAGTGRNWSKPIEKAEICDVFSTRRFRSVMPKLTKAGVVIRETPNSHQIEFDLSTLGNLDPRTREALRQKLDR